MSFDDVLLLARLSLFAVFAVAGVAKLLDLSGTRAALTGFGVPVTLARPLGVLLPLAELAVAVLLVPHATAWWGAIGALALLVLFVAGISVSMARGTAPDCHCFGQLHSSPAGWSTLARNALLAAVAGVVLVAGRDDPGTSVSTLFESRSGFDVAVTLVGLALVAVVIVEAWLLWHLLGQNGRMLTRLESLEAILTPGDDTGEAPAAQPTRGLPIGSAAPAFSLPGVHGETLTLDALRAAGKPVMLLFSDPNCGPCNAMMPDVARWQRDHAERISVVVVSRGGVETNRKKAAQYELSRLLVQQDRETSELYRAVGTPSAVVVGADGKIASPVAGGAAAVQSLLWTTLASGSSGAQRRSNELPMAVDARGPAAAADQGAAPAAHVAKTNGAATQPAGNGRGILTVGDVAPNFTLADLRGDTVDLASYRGSDTLVLFWNPGCGFCRRMLDDLKEWEANPPVGAPKLLVVSTGSVEDNAAQGLRSTVVLDQGFNAGRSFGASGTPSAVLVDAESRIASAVAVGAPGVMELARMRQQV